MISKYLKELIENNNRIIIPDFGAFMIQDSPDGKQIAFNDFLKFNDGLLVNQIIKAEKISKNQASDIIKDFIKDVEKSFATNKPYEVTGIGFLTKDSHGNIKFETKIMETSKPKVAHTDEKPTIVLDEKTVVSTEKLEPALSKEEVKDVKPIEQQVPQKPPVLKVKEEQPIKTTNVPENKPSSGLKSSTQKSPITPKKMQSNTKKVILISLLVIILIGGGTGAFLFFDLGKHFYTFFGPKKTTPTEIVAGDTLLAADAAASIPSEAVEEPTVVEEPVEKVATHAKKYYIVAGSFKIASNAERYNKRLTSEGYSSEIVMRKNGFHLVSYKMVYNRDEARAEWNKMRDINPQTWIYVK